MKELVVFPDDYLRVKSQPVEEFGSALNQVIDDMTWVMRVLTGNGLGISAIQTREALRIGIIEQNYKSTKKGKPLVMCNPVILEMEQPDTDREGCLSFPGKFIPIKRPSVVRIRYQDQEGVDRFRIFSGIFARCVLHEIDHMNGVLFIDHAKEKPDWLE